MGAPFPARLTQPLWVRPSNLGAGRWEAGTGLATGVASSCLLFLFHIFDCF